MLLTNYCSTQEAFYGLFILFYFILGGIFGKEDCFGKHTRLLMLQNCFWSSGLEVLVDC